METMSSGNLLKAKIGSLINQRAAIRLNESKPLLDTCSPWGLFLSVLRVLLNQLADSDL